MRSTVDGGVGRNNARFQRRIGSSAARRVETRRYRHDAEADAERLVARVEADQRPDQNATVGMLLDRWMEIVDHELSAAETTAGYVRRTLRPALGDMTRRKLQDRVDILDRLYSHLRRAMLRSVCVR